MTEAQRIEAIINDMEVFGECFIGTTEVQGNKVVKLAKKLNKEIQRRTDGRKVLAFDGKNGIAWMA